MTTITLFNNDLKNTLHLQKEDFLLQQVIKFAWSCLC